MLLLLPAKRQANKEFSQRALLPIVDSFYFWSRKQFSSHNENKWQTNITGTVVNHSSTSCTTNQTRSKKRNLRKLSPNEKEKRYCNDDTQLKRLLSFRRLLLQVTVSSHKRQNTSVNGEQMFLIPLSCHSTFGYLFVSFRFLTDGIVHRLEWHNCWWSSKPNVLPPESVTARF